jgi:hypothetical protein
MFFTDPIYILYPFVTLSHTFSLSSQHFFFRSKEPMNNVVFLNYNNPHAVA